MVARVGVIWLAWWVVAINFAIAGVPELDLPQIGSALKSGLEVSLDNGGKPIVKNGIVSVNVVVKNISSHPIKCEMGAGFSIYGFSADKLKLVKLSLPVGGSQWLADIAPQEEVKMPVNMGVDYQSQQYRDDVFLAVKTLDGDKVLEVLSAALKVDYGPKTLLEKVR